LASDEYKPQLDWAKVHIFFGDERCVSPEDPQSNYRMANEALLSRVPIPPQNVHRIRGLGDAVSNARLYEEELRTYFNDADWPRFDLVFLGMGDDGHTASLFPDSPVLYETEAMVSANWIAKFDSYRITLTAPAINHAAHLVFLVTGENKAKRLAEIVNSVHLPKRLPVQLINPVNGSLEWLVDKSAAAGLSQGEEVNNRDGAAQ
jgi:6-phosphogluconolactonase